MSEHRKSSKLTPTDRLIERMLTIAPWLAFLLIALPAPLYFFLRSFSGVDEPGVYVLLALTSLAVGSVVGLLVALALVFYRRLRQKKLRDKLAADGITTDELPHFAPEMTRAERRALRQIEGQNALLADAYRETLAARLTAARVIKRAEREAVAIDRRARRSASLDPQRAAALREELRADREKVQEIIRTSRDRRGEAEAQLQIIEAAAGRGATAADVGVALDRLSSTSGQTPYALEKARLQQQALQEAERELKLLEQSGE